MKPDHIRKERTSYGYVAAHVEYIAARLRKSKTKRVRAGEIDTLQATARYIRETGDGIVAELTRHPAAKP